VANRNAQIVQVSVLVLVRFVSYTTFHSVAGSSNIFYLTSKLFDVCEVLPIDVLIWAIIV